MIPIQVFAPYEKKCNATEYFMFIKWKRRHKGQRGHGGHRKHKGHKGKGVHGGHRKHKEKKRNIRETTGHKQHKGTQRKQGTQDDTGNTR